MRNCLALLVLACAPLFAEASITYTGSLSSTDAVIDGVGAWVTTATVPATISWTISENTNGTWHYDYAFSAYKYGVSHLIIETSPTFTMQNVTNAHGPFDDLLVKTNTPQMGSPSMPGNLYGLRFDSMNGTTVDVSFDSDRAPTWGDFYAKGGQCGAWNESFIQTDPTQPAANGSVGNKILVPGTVSTVPEPATLLLLTMGGIALLARRKRLGQNLN